LNKDRGGILISHESLVFGAVVDIEATKHIGGLHGFLFFDWHGETEFGHVILVLLVHVQSGVKLDNYTIMFVETHVTKNELRVSLREIKPPRRIVGVVGIEHYVTGHCWDVSIRFLVDIMSDIFLLD
jgi:hypothetical protein